MRPLPPITIYGDWPHLPAELRGTEAATRNLAGERAAGSRLFTSQVALHDGSGTTR
jgi:hypothetical protein